jgi:hypothetical protein
LNGTPKGWASNTAVPLFTSYILPAFLHDEAPGHIKPLTLRSLFVFSLNIVSQSPTACLRLISLPRFVLPFLDTTQSQTNPLLLSVLVVIFIFTRAIFLPRFGLHSSGGCWTPPVTEDSALAFRRRFKNALSTPLKSSFWLYTQFGPNSTR